MQIFWIELNKLKYHEFLSELLEFRKQNIVFTPNPEMLLKAKKDKNFKKILKKADYLTVDWIWLYLGFQILDFYIISPIGRKLLWVLLLPYYIFNLIFRKKYLYNKYSHRICGSDLTEDLVKYCEKNNIKITIIDPYYPFDKEKVESQINFRKNLLKKFPKLNFDFFIYKDNKKTNIINRIKNSNSKILFSTLWMKKQEESVIEIIEKCKNIKIWLWVWSSFDYFIWFQKRAPKFFRTIWLEWLYRLITWTYKINRAKRLYNAIFVFIFWIYISL